MKLFLLTALPTYEMRRGIFPHPADKADHSYASARLSSSQNSLIRTPYQVYSSPYLCARETCTWMEVNPIFEPALAERNYGLWRGKSLKAIATQDPLAFKRWQENPASAPPQGESMEALYRRASFWLTKMEDLAAQTTLHILTITHAAFIRAVMGNVLGIPNIDALKIDIAPLTYSVFSFQKGWRIQSVGAPLVHVDFPTF